MTTLITFGNSEGDRRCDARCHDAKESECNCCCGGMNHGAGLKQATQNTTEMSRKMIKRAGIKIKPIQAVFDI